MRPPQERRRIAIDMFCETWDKGYRKSFAAVVGEVVTKLATRPQSKVPLASAKPYWCRREYRCVSDSHAS